MSYLSTLVREGKFEMPPESEIEKMDLIDVRRKLMKFCDESQGAIGPCRTCMRKCNAGKWALQLYDRLQVPKTEEPEVAKNISEEKDEKQTTQSGGQVAQWYIDAKASKDPVAWCVDNLHITRQQASKKIYMYEYNHFGTLRTKNTAKATEKPRLKHAAKAAEKPANQTDESDFSLATDLQQKMEMLTKRQSDYREQIAYHQCKIDELKKKEKKVTDQIDAVSMCLELIN